jgi:DNA polymerase elongation subunit (family B)
MLHLVEDWCTAKNIKVIYGDTDSVFVTSEDEIDEHKIHTQINEFIAYYILKYFGITVSHMDLKVEAVYDSFLLVEKKKYVKNEDGHLKIVGLEARKRDTLPFTALKQTEFLQNLLLNSHDKEQVIDWIIDLKKYVLSREMRREDVMLQIKLSKHVDEYLKKKKDKKTKETVLDENGDVVYLPSSLAHIKVANWLKENNIRENNSNTWEKGSYVKYIITDGSKKIQATSIHNYEEGQYDPAYYWDVKIYAPIMRILECVWPETNWKDYLVTNKPVRVSKKK